MQFQGIFTKKLELTYKSKIQTFSNANYPLWKGSKIDFQIKRHAEQCSLFFPAGQVDSAPEGWQLHSPLLEQLTILLNIRYLLNTNWQSRDFMPGI